jgi:pimeloyl-ACP methyl ester carboxylesterase
MSMHRFESFDGVNIAYGEWNRVGSEGPPVVLHHGFAADSQVNWVVPGVVDALVSAGRSVVAIDARGHGQSDKPHDPACYGELAMARDVEQLLGHLDVGKFDLVGYSMGSIVSLLVATREVELRRLVIGGIGSRVAEHGGAALTPRRREAIAAVLEADEVDDEVPPAALAFRRFADSTGADRLALAAQMRAAHTDGIPFEQITAKAMVIVGDRDDLGGDPQSLADAIGPGTELVIVSGDHLGAVTDPAFTSEIVRFLAS